MLASTIWYRTSISVRSLADTAQTEKVSAIVAAATASNDCISQFREIFMIGAPKPISAPRACLRVTFVDAQ